MKERQANTMKPDNYYKVSVRTAVAIGGGPGFVYGPQRLKPTEVTGGMHDKPRVYSWVFPFRTGNELSVRDALANVEAVIAGLECLPLEERPRVSAFALCTHDRARIGTFPESGSADLDPEFLN